MAVKKLDLDSRVWELLHYIDDLIVMIDAPGICQFTNHPEVNLGSVITKIVVGHYYWDQFPAPFSTALNRAIESINQGSKLERFIHKSPSLSYQVTVKPYHNHFYWVYIKALSPMPDLLNSSSVGITIVDSIASHNSPKSSSSSEGTVSQQEMHLQNFEQELSSQILMVQEQERAQLSRKLHDQLGQRLAVLKMRMSHIENQISDQLSTEFAEDLAISLSLIDDSIRKVRQITTELRTPLLGELNLEESIRAEFELMSSHLILKMDWENLRLSSSQTILFFRVAREALTNVIKHARATHVWVSLKTENDHIVLRVKDDGVGIDDSILSRQNSKDSWGLVSIKEWVHTVGGSLQIETNNGTTLILKVPMC